MTLKPEGPSPRETELAGSENDTPVIERVQELTWAALDDVASDDDLRLLDNLLLSDDEAIGEYVNCVQMHCDLLALYSPEGALPGASALSFLNE